jgi:hypothetical protein
MQIKKIIKKRNADAGWEKKNITRAKMNNKTHATKQDYSGYDAVGVVEYHECTQSRRRTPSRNAN